MRKLFLLLFLAPVLAMAQTKPITLEDIYKKGTFRGEFVPAVFDTTQKEPELKLDGLKDETGKAFGQAEDQVENPVNKQLWLLKKGNEPIYRRSSKSFVYLYDASSGKLSKLENEKVLHPTFSPDGSKIAYVKENNLYIYDIAAGKATAVTTDGKWNFVINGNCDWVYEEEFEFTRAYEWSPKGNFIAYYRFDESAVKEYNLTMYDNAHNKDYRYKYPKAGDGNSTVDIYIYDVAKNSKAKAQYEPGDIYIPRIKWTRDDNTLVVYWMNRHQNDLKLLSTNASTGASSLLYQETNKYYVEINDDWWYL